MTEPVGYLSKDRGRINQGQRSRRAQNPRIDYYPSREARAIIEAKRGEHYPLNINSGILDCILTEWADLSGIKYREVAKPMTSGRQPELLDHSARTNESGKPWPQNPTPVEHASGISRHFAKARAGEQTSGAPPGPAWRITCGAKTRNGTPCRAKSLPGKQRCKWHGGCSTGPKSEAGKARAIANLRRGPAREVAEQTS